MEIEVSKVFVRIRQQLLGLILQQLQPLISKADPNWMSATVRLRRGPATPPSELDRYLEATGSYTGPPAFDATPVAAYLHGPAGGDVPLDVDAVRRLVDPPLWAALVQTDHLLPRGHTGYVTFSNPGHAFQAVPARTRLLLQGELLGHVLSGDRNAFIVARGGESVESATRLERYDFRRIVQEAAVPEADRKPGHVTGFHYLPKRFDEKADPLERPIEPIAITPGIRAVIGRLGSKSVLVLR